MLLLFLYTTNIGPPKIQISCTQLDRRRRCSVGATHGTIGVRMEPHINAFDMVRVQTLWQNSQLLTFFKFIQANCTRSITHQARALLELKGWDVLRRGTLNTALRLPWFLSHIVVAVAE
ncbi:hypothetical protein OIU76_012366 [Salix suchowensis]|nr:hypothetical protein OIU76_012366 [Salix suchowensis]